MAMCKCKEMDPREKKEKTLPDVPSPQDAVIGASVGIHKSTAAIEWCRPVSH